jgi:hypothetical protein
MEVRLVAEGTYVRHRKIEALMQLGFKFQKDFTQGPGPTRTCWVAVNSPIAKLDSDTLIEISRIVGAPLRVETHRSVPTVFILKK